ncbi:MAG: FKBP-type peptidyl-prolyl cis-trans isomerase [Planctomycetota bacterium]|jgi:FKBP-type peptidyl-prolyl cis-trans isomerase
MKSILLCRWLACAILVATGTCAFGQQPPQLKPQLPEVPGIKDPISYALGLNVGSSLRNASFQPSDFDIEQFANGFSDGLAKSEKLTPEQIEACLMLLDEKVRKKMTDIARNNLEKANEFLKANKEKEGVQTTKSGLQYLVIKAGTGKTPTVTSRVTVHYEGKLLDGTIFDSSIKAGEPAEFRVNEVIPGWTEALQRMKVGDKWRLFIPPGLAYGERGQRPQIGQNELLTFEVELLDVK